MYAWQFAKAQSVAPTRFVSVQTTTTLRRLAVQVRADFDVVERARKVADERGSAAAQVTLTWLLHRPGVTAPIVGATRPEHLDDALVAEQPVLDEEEIFRLEEPYVPHAIAGH